MNAELCPKAIFTKLLLAYIIVLIPNIVVIIIKLNYNYTDIRGMKSIMNLFDFDREANFPTLYSFIILFFCAILLFNIANAKKTIGSEYYYWLGLAFIFLFLSIDEITMLHERTSEPLRRLLGTSGVLFFAWIIPYGLALIVFVALYLRFLIKLPKKIMFLFIVSGVIYVTGAIGLEIFGGMEANLQGYESVLFYILYTCEESFEMFGGIIFIYTLLSYMADEFKYITIKIN